MNKLEMRPLNGGDVFTILELMDRMDIVEPIQELISGEKRKQIIEKFSGNKKEESLSNQDIGFEIAFDIAKLAIKKVPKAQKEINSFLAELTGKTVIEVKSLPLKSYFGLVTDFFKKPELGELLKSVSLLGK